MSETSQNLRLPPHNEEAEQSIIGSMMLDHMALSAAMKFLEPRSFYRPAHQKIYNAVLNLDGRGEPVDQITVVDELKRSGDLQAVGGAYYITELTEKVPSTANAEYYARLVMESSALRALIQLSAELSTEAYETRERVDVLLEKAESKIFELSEKRFRIGDFVPIRTALDEAFVQADKFHNNPGGIRGVATGFEKLDDVTSGFQNSDLIIIAARPSMGKTALALSIARNASVKYGHKIAIFSLEMSNYQLAMRLLCSEAKVDAHLVRTGRLPSNLWPRLSTAAGNLAEAEIFLDDSASLNITELRAKARRLKAEKDIDLIIVDYMQLLQGSGRVESRQQEISQISRSFKMLAKELDLPIVALSQLSRAVETRGGDKRPILSDLRESGSIEQDADVVMFIYRPEKYGVLDDDGNTQEGIAELIVAKQRNGPTGTVRLSFIDKFASFENLSAYTPAATPGGGNQDQF
ncbi:MAG: replicative DNA helicase [Candidatus Marinimicrobia bacterium]|nr:replicative DNA helicase [Candidatus Neomarinimicrobiota bacterium]